MAKKSKSSASKGSPSPDAGSAPIIIQGANKTTQYLAFAFLVVVVFIMFFLAIRYIFGARGLKRAGEECGSDRDCLNGQCGIARSSDKTKSICCPNSIATGILCNGTFNAYCTGLENGSACCSSTVCANGNCTGGATYGGYCEGNGVTGSQCSADEWCTNKTCAYPAAKTSKKQCCPTRKTVMPTSPFGDTFCADMPLGTLCYSSTQCADGYCTGSGSTHGVCKGKKQNYEPCSSKDECVKNACGRLQGTDKKDVCCPSGNAVKPNGAFKILNHYYCTEVPEGDKCWGTKYCQRGFHCVGNNNFLNHPGTCRKKK